MKASIKEHANDLKRLQREDFRRKIAMGIEQVDRGELAPLNISDIKKKVRRRFKTRS